MPRPARTARSSCLVALLSIAVPLGGCDTARKLVAPPAQPASGGSLEDTRYAAERGNARAQYDMALRYASGSGVPRDHAEATRWYRLAAESGNAEAQQALGVRYREGIGVERDAVESAAWLLRAAEQGNRKAQEQLGVAYFRGEGVTRDYVEAYKWLRIASDAGSASAQYFLPSVGEDLTRRELETAEQRARDWQVAYRQGPRRP